MDLKNKTLIILSPAFPADESDEQSPWLPAQQIFIRALNRNFPEMEIIVLAFQFPLKKMTYSWHGNQIIPFGGGNRRRGHNLNTWYKVFRQLTVLGKEKEIIGLISFWCAECCLVGSYFSRLRHYKHLCWISGQDARKDNKFVKRIRPKPVELVAMSDFLADEFHKNHGIRPQHFIPDAIDTSLFPAGPMDKTIDILGAGNLVPLKRYNIFVEVVAAVAAKLPAIKAMLCGGGTEEEKIKDQIEALKLSQTLYCTGLQPHTTVLGLMKKAKILLHTSSYEGFGNVCIEALYAGAHVISFTKPMHRSIPHWHIVSTKEEMIAKALDILQDEQTAYSPVLPFDMNDSAKKFMELLMA